jgi:hypothetical protein
MNWYKISEQNNPCWDGYEQIGTKKKNGKDVPNCVPKDSRTKESSSEAWQREEGKSDKGGLNQKGRDSYNKEHGGNLKEPVTEDNPTGKDKDRQDSYCSRSKGQMKQHNIDCSKTPDKPICKSRKRWNCN